MNDCVLEVMANIVYVLAVVSAFASAYCWWKSATIRVVADISEKLMKTYRSLGRDRIVYTHGGGTFYTDKNGRVFDHEKTLYIQSRFNRWAAGLTGWTIFLQYVVVPLLRQVERFL